MKKIIPVSLLAIWIACPALAENFPNDGYMLENKTYDNAATYENMGVYSDSVEANAYYDDCPANSYCDASGQHSCPSGYPNSAAGASASTECFKACTTENVPHSTAVTGNDYNGGVDTCAPTSCVAGYHVGESTTTLAAVLGNSTATNRASIDNNGNVSGNAATYGISSSNTFAVDYGALGVVTGQARCSSHGGTTDNWSYANPEIVDDLPVETGGAWCYCRLESYTPSGGTVRNATTPWVLMEEASQFELVDWVCREFCAGDCAGALSGGGGSNHPYGALLFGMVNVNANMCVANTITINWSDVDGEENPFATNVAYDGDIDTPVKAATYPGKIFTGWRFVRPDDEYGS